MLTRVPYASSCNKTYLYQSSLKKHFKLAHEQQYRRYLKER